MRRTRGDITLFFRRTAAPCAELEVFFRAVAPFGCALVDFAAVGLFAVAGFFSLLALPVVDCGGVAELEEDSWGAAEVAFPTSPHSPANASTHHNLRPKRPTVYFDARRSAQQNLFSQSPELRAASFEKTMPTCS